MNDQYPASFQQRQFFWLHNLDKNSSAYNIPLIFTIDGNLDQDLLKTAFIEVFGKNRILNTFFSSGENTYTIHGADFSHIDTFDIIENDNDDIDSLFDQIYSFVSLPFDLKSGPLYRSLLIKREPKHYIWCIVMHHTICDLRTKELLCDHLGKKYHELKTAENYSNKEFSVNYDYKSYAISQNEWTSSEPAFKMIEFWKKFLSGYPQHLSLPLDYKRPSYLKLEGTVVPISFCTLISSKIREFSKNNDVTPFLCLFTAYAVLLHRYSGQDKFLIGTPFTNRRDERKQQTVGCFVNTLPIPVDCSVNVPMIDLMNSIRKSMLFAHRNQELPTELIIKNLANSNINIDENPLYQTGFTFEPLSTLEIPECIVTQRYIHHGGSQLDLFATFWVEEDTFQGVLEYNDNLFKHESITKWAENFQYLVQNFIEQPDKLIHAIPLITDNEKIRIEQHSKSDLKIDSKSISFPEMFLSMVNKYPLKTALSFNNSETSYLSLCNKSNCIKNHLLSKGIKPDQVVGVLMDRSDEMLIAIVGILLSGAAYLPLDPKFPTERKNFIINDSQVRFIIADTKNSESIKDCSTTVLHYEEMETLKELETPENILIDANSAAYMIYTSGSTGKPKGVTITHRNLNNFILSMIKEPGLSETDRILAITTISFDIHILELLLPLSVGSSIVIAPEDAQKDVTQLIELFYNNDISIMQATPVTWKLLCTNGWKGKKNGFTLLCGGEAMSVELSRQLLQCCSKLYNMYGPTETTVWSTCYRVTGSENNIPIGKPIANTITMIRDKWGNPVPTGVWGELLIGGEGVARGYHNREQLTREKFLSVDFTNSKLLRFYTTGDICRLTADGLLECVGRIDNQIKLNGYRIELEEIERTIETHPDISAAAIVEHGQHELTMLVAFVVLLKQCNSLDSESIRDFLVKRLPSYMIPVRYIQIPELPLTPNRKIDRIFLKNSQLIPLPEILSKSNLLCTDNLEKVMVDIWASDLRLDIKDIDARFFDVGGSSLSLLKLKDKIYEKINIDITIPILLQYPSIRSLANHLKSQTVNNNLKSTQTRIELQKKAMKKIAKR